MTPFFFGSTESMKALERRVRSIASSDLPVLIEGESGAGKETLAEHIHELRHSDGVFVRSYCGQEEQFQLARLLSRDAGGAALSGSSLRATLCLKHIDLLCPKLQQELLRAIHAGLGSDGNGDGHVPALRLIATAVEPLEPLVAHGNFLSDLYFRLAVYRLLLPPLRERMTDLEDLFALMVQQASGDGNGAVPPPLPRLLHTFKTYRWPGNLRELQNFASSYAVSHDADQIIAEIERRSKSLNVIARPGAASLKEQVRRASKQLESEIILKALDQHRWNRRRAAQSLKISYRALLYKMKDCKLREDVAEESD